MTGMKSSSATIFVSVELQVLSFCLVELTMGNPCPRDNPPLECPRMLGCTTQDQRHCASASDLSHQMDQFFQSSLSGAPTLVARNAIAVQVSNLARLVE
jgi:hypothetical protein